jgi:hypothetical protein
MSKESVFKLAKEIEDSDNRKAKMLSKIEKGSCNGVFDWILENENNATWPENNSAMIRELVKKYNELIDYLNQQPKQDEG